ncbi:Gfo/Idh/MocA family protein [Zunongwangia endophytica]|uniref:Gfo/Idh/MocA family protein n=1 Tax=Zunongwangia endophytica TaxID=1808945 RepID=A0ABV8HEX4_9FLAO|nr:Gfo/Idh/MocA family oxidoreductase [Zunongwangia endophytica]MDN3596904.1 Gfo/Idh/MocA family oxidoreductase [Zunongwangia endophytica]
MKRIKIALIGTGYISNYHIRGLMTIPEVEIAAVVSKHLRNAKKFAESYDIEKAYSSIIPIIKDTSIDAVIISTPNVFHAPYAIEFLKNGKDVFLEKPMAMNTEEGENICTTAKETKHLVMIGHMWRFDEDAKFIKQSIANGKLGRIFKTKGYGIHENWGPSGWFIEKKLAGGGALADMGIHAIDTIRYLLGDPNPVQVYAKITTNFGDYDVDDTAIILITWDNGTESIIESGWWQPHMDGPEASSAIFGTKGYASLFPTFLKLKKGEASEQLISKTTRKKEHCDQLIYTRQMQYFIECIKTRTQPSPGLKEGLVTLKIIDAAYASAKKRTVINL